MGHSTCCVVNCKNNGLNSHCKFFIFPRARHAVLQRRKWIEAVKRLHPDGSTWSPRPSDLICSAHFVHNKKSNDPLNPSYAPTIFPSASEVKVTRRRSKINRHNHYKKRKNQNLPLPATSKNEQQVNTMQSDTLKYADKGCQIYTYIDSVEPEKTFTCNRYVNISSYNNVEIQTEIIENSHIIIIPNQTKFQDIKCEVPQEIYVNQSIEADFKNKTTPNFTGISSIENDQQLLDLTGVTFDNFNFLLNILSKDPTDNSEISQENKLFIFLFKMKTGLTFEAINVLFPVNRVTISSIFYSILQELASATANLVFWPNKNIVQGTMPQCFYPYSDTRVIIDFPEFRIKVPANVDNQMYTYSHYKKIFTAKALIGITPGGFISFKSKVAGGNMSDSQIIIESGLIDILEDGDTVSTDKSFPKIQRMIEEKGKKVSFVIPPFLQIKDQFVKDGTEEPYDVAKILIYLERNIQRLRTYNILDNMPENLFHCIDDILHVCCVLVNLQTPISADIKVEENE